MSNFRASSTRIFRPDGRRFREEEERARDLDFARDEGRGFREDDLREEDRRDTDRDRALEEKDESNGQLEEVVRSVRDVSEDSSREASLVMLPLFLLDCFLFPLCFFADVFGLMGDSVVKTLGRGLVAFCLFRREPGNDCVRVTLLPLRLLLISFFLGVSGLRSGWVSLASLFGGRMDFISWLVSVSLPLTFARLTVFVATPCFFSR